MSSIFTKIFYVGLFAIPPIISMFYSYYYSFRSPKIASDTFIRTIESIKNEYNSDEINVKNEMIDEVKSKYFLL